jgi:hypothetical protein
MPSGDTFTTYTAAKQAEIVTKLMDLFKGNERAHGVAEVSSFKWIEDKNKWKPDVIRLPRTQATENDWVAHLSGQIFLGISPLLDDGTVWFTCMDIDKIGEDESYDVNYGAEMKKIKESGFPLVVFRTKSGGLRPTIFFNEPVEAELARRRMTQMAAQLGYGGCEIFPKQDKVVISETERIDFPSWIFVPFGPTPKGMKIPEQCCMDDVGNEMDMYQGIIYALRMRISREKFLSLTIEDQKARANGKANGKRHPKGRWQAEETWRDTVEATFWDGPICLWHIALNKSKDNQHYFLLNVASFVRRKYPENWDEALSWVNFNVLSPTGNADRLREMINNLKSRKDYGYEYTCKSEPICSHCHARACRKQPFGVGTGNGVMDHWEWGLTIVNSEPRRFFINIADTRVCFDASDILTEHKFSERCMAYGIPIPPMMSKKEWLNLVNKNIEDATIVEPSVLYKPNVSELLALRRFFSTIIPSMVRAKGEEYLSGKVDERVRVKSKEERIYFKWEALLSFCERALQYTKRDIDALRAYVDKSCEWHDRTESKGRWYRSSWSIRFDQFDPDELRRWLNPDIVEEEEEQDEHMGTPQN